MVAPHASRTKTSEFLWQNELNFWAADQPTTSSGHQVVFVDFSCRVTSLANNLVLRRHPGVWKHYRAT